MSWGNKMKTFVHSAISFSVPSTTCLTLLVYTAIFISSIILYEVVPTAPAPSQQLGLDLNAAFRDLQVIAAGPHPYNSHANDAVRSHILSRIITIADLHNNIDVIDDLKSNGTWSLGSSVGAYFEGSNILVKIDGKEPDIEAVLFSAHFDSVSTAPGATDDGMGVATLIQLVEYFANNTPKRTVIFNINNAEEDGLYGAHAFLEHPWSKLPKLFLNLEGAGSGGRAMLFRTSSDVVTRAFTSVSHPHGSVLSSDAFSRGLIRSGTDFEVYQKDGMKGLDLAFYKQRSLYHTKHDSVPSLGGLKPLWNMMEAALQSGIALTEETPVYDVDQPAVYFDIYGETLVVLTLRAVFILNLVFLIVGPLLVAAGIALVYMQGKLHWSRRGWFRFPLALIVGFGFPIGLAILYAYVNPYIVYSSGYVVTISLIALAFISIHVPLTSLSYLRPVPQQKSIILLETYVVWWIFLVWDTVLVNKQHIGGLYVITFFHATSFFALLVTLLEHLRLPAAASAHPGTNDPNYIGVEVQTEEDHSETTPLLQRERDAYKIDIQEGEHYGFWVLEYLLLVPFPAILVTQIGIILLGALPQTLADGSSVFTVYLALALLGSLIVIPAAPFVHKLHRSIMLAFLIVLLGTGFYNLFAFPFSRSSPLKVFFSQTVDLDNGTNAVNLTGVFGYVEKKIIPELPSSWNKSIDCSLALDRRVGLQTCQWQGLTPAVTPSRTNDWLSFNATLVAPGTALIKLHGENTRACRIYFDHPVTSVRVDGSTGEVQHNYPFPSDGIKELRLWSRTWDKEFVVTATWAGRETMTGRVSCGWAETLEGRIPAFAEVIGFLPDWVQVTKANDALVEGIQRFSV